MVKKGNSEKDGNKKKEVKTFTKAQIKAGKAKASKKWKSWRTRQKVWKKNHPHLFNPVKKNYSIGNDTQPRRNLSRFVRWPHYIKIQRKKKILMERLKVPPSIHQFTKTLEKNSAHVLFSLLFKYRPESKYAKKQRIKKLAEKELKGEPVVEVSKRKKVKYGMNEVTRLIEQKKAKLVVIANDVDPVELVVWMPALCHKMGVPYCIVKNRARLGLVCHKKKATCLAITSVNKEDVPTLENLVGLYLTQYNDQYSNTMKKWGGGQLGFKARARLRKKMKQREIEAKKMGKLIP